MTNKPKTDAGKAAERLGLKPIGDWRARLEELIDAYKSRAQAAAVAGVGPNQLGRYLRGDQQPSWEIMARLAEGAGYSLDWLWNGIGIGPNFPLPELPQDMVAVPILDIRAGAGAEQFIDDESPISELTLPRAFLLAHRVKPNHARLMLCIGDSMEPTIRDGSPMVVDTSDLGQGDDIYVLRRGSGITVKRLQHLSDGTIILKSDNPAYEPDRLPRDEADELKVLGRVGLVLQAI